MPASDGLSQAEHLGEGFGEVALLGAEGCEEALESDGRHREVPAVESGAAGIHILYLSAVGAGAIARERDGEVA